MNMGLLGYVLYITYVNLYTFHVEDTDLRFLFRHIPVEYWAIFIPLNGVKVIWS